MMKLPGRSGVRMGGRHPAPAMVEHDRHGRPLGRPFPLRRRWVRALVAVMGLVGLTVVERNAIPGLLLVTAAAAALLPRLLVPMPYPAFVSAGEVQAHALAPQSWLRLRSGHAVQAMNVHIRLPDTVGDPTPPLVEVRCSDDVTRSYRPHDVLHLVQPVDLRSPSAARLRPR